MVHTHVRTQARTHRYTRTRKHTHTCFSITGRRSAGNIMVIDAYLTEHDIQISEFVLSQTKVKSKVNIIVISLGMCYAFDRVKYNVSI